MEIQKSNFVGNNQYLKKTKKELFEEKYVIDETTKCWNWIARKTRAGYGQFNFNGATYQAPRVAWILYVGEIPEGLWILHRCDNPARVNPDHLFLGTQDDNMKDMAKKGRGTRGEKAYTCKLNVDIVKEIRNSKESTRYLSNQYGITMTTVYQIKHRESWKWVE